jgi:glutaredoxin 3
MNQPKHVRLFIKSYCPWCRQAMDWLDAHGIRYQVLDVIANGPAYDEMVRLSGQSLAPVIEVDGRILADFGPRELAEFWKRLPAQTTAP